MMQGNNMTTILFWVPGFYGSIGMRVFDGVTRSVNTIMGILKYEHTLWCLAGARKLQVLGLAGVI
jgi:hypothetical protein